MQGVITAIQRMSIHDGPGIRSTVFLKGCNFRCKWCHNPETWSFEAQLQRIKERCIMCGSCVASCNSSAISIKSGEIIIDRSLCSVCGECAEACFSNSLSITGKKIDSESLINELLKDKPYFDESSGGVTLSGGEPLLQYPFVKDILGRCRQEGIHVAIESNLSVSSDIIKDLIPLVDLWMVDLKIADDTLHRKMVGASNINTINNLKILSESGADIIVRTPVIPTINDNTKSISEICEILKGLGIKNYQLLPFHSLGFEKFRYFDMQNPMEEFALCRVESMDKLYDVLKEYNLK